MPSIPKTKKIELLAKMLQKRFKGLPLPPDRGVLEHLLYAALLENAAFEQADMAYAVLKEHFIDWNEIRVSTVRELADAFSMLPDPTATAERVRRSLQGVFEKTYAFDLEDMRKKGKTLSQALDFFRVIGVNSRFMVDYTAQVALGGHCIPVDEAAFRVFRLLGLTQVNKEGTQEEVPGLERAVPKKDGIPFFLRLHHFATGFFHDPDSAELRALLKAIDSDALNRNWVPPVLVVPKAAQKSAPKRPAPVAAVPFPVADDDEDEEESVGTEAEFLPDDSPYRPDTPSRDSADIPKKSKEKKKTPTPTVAKPVVAKPVEPSSPPKQEEPKKPSPAKEAAKPPQAPAPPPKPVPVSTKQPEVKKDSGKPKTPPKPPAVKALPEQAVAKTPPGQAAAKAPPKKTPVKQPPKNTPVKEAPEAQKPKSAPSEPKDKAPAKQTKSSTRQLREKKPK